MNPPKRATCARCRRPEHIVEKFFPEGPLCAACHGEAARRRGACAVCGRTRLLPGAGTAGERLCCECAGIAEDYVG